MIYQPIPEAAANLLNAYGRDALSELTSGIVHLKGVHAITVDALTLGKQLVDTVAVHARSTGQEVVAMILRHGSERTGDSTAATGFAAFGADLSACTAVPNQPATPLHTLEHIHDIAHASTFLTVMFEFLHLLIECESKLTGGDVDDVILHYESQPF